MKHLSLYFLLCLLLCGCQTTINVDVPRNPAKLTANILFTPDSLWQAELSQNRFILDTDTFAYVLDAQVRVMQGGNTVAVLEYAGDDRFSGNSTYRAREGRPRAGGQYSLEVVRPGMGTLTAASRVPVPTPIISVVWDTLDIRNDPSFTGGDVAYGLSIRFADPPEANFYSLSLGFRKIQVGGRFNDSGEIEDFIEETFLVGGGLQSGDPIVDKVFDRYSSELLFKDISFNGQEYELKLYFRQQFSVSPDNIRSYLDDHTKGFTLSDAVYNRQRDKLYPPGTTFYYSTMYAVLRTTTEEYYRYHYTRDLQASVEKNPFAQPVQVYNNIGNGLGIFAGYSQTQKQATFK